MKVNYNLRSVNASVTILFMVNLCLTSLCSCAQDAFSSSQSNGIIDDNINIKTWTRPHQKRHNGHAITQEDNDFSQPLPRRHKNFILIDYLKDGEMERRINYNGVTAKETSISTPK